jgi:hypothetical protein
MVQQVQSLHRLNISAMNTSHTLQTAVAHSTQLLQLYLLGLVRK